MENDALPVPVKGTLEVTADDPRWIFNKDATDHAWRIAKTLAESDLLPETFRGKVSNCLVGLFLAHTLALDPLTLYPQLGIIKGKPSIGAALMHSLAEQRGGFDGPIEFDEVDPNEGDDEAAGYRVRAFAHRGGRKIAGTWVSMAMARGEGWTANPKYKTMPRHMLRFRAVAFFVREVCPSVVLGMQTREELLDRKWATARPGAAPEEIEVDDVPSGRDLSALAELNKRGAEERGQSPGMASHGDRPPPRPSASAPPTTDGSEAWDPTSIPFPGARPAGEAASAKPSGGASEGDAPPSSEPGSTGTLDFGARRRNREK